MRPVVSPEKYFKYWKLKLDKIVSAYYIGNEKNKNSFESFNKWKTRKVKYSHTPLKNS